MTHSIFIPLFPLANMFYSFQQSNLPGKAIVLLLLAGSIYAWTVMLSKWVEVRRARMSTALFLSSYQKQPDPLDVFRRGRKFVESPLFRIYRKGCVALGAELESLGSSPEDLFTADFSARAGSLDRRQFEMWKNVMERHVADESLGMERRMLILSTAVTASPFLGLLGTVWGVMAAFTGMAKVGTATLSAVAPGIAAALLTTVMGLLVAIPSSIGYNMLSGRINELQVLMMNFSKEFTDEVSTLFQKPE
jgi:biopolymer transport protein TolQ